MITFPLAALGQLWGLAPSRWLASAHVVAALATTCK